MKINIENASIMPGRMEASGGVKNIATLNFDGSVVSHIFSFLAHQELIACAYACHSFLNIIEATPGLFAKAFVSPLLLKARTIAESEPLLLRERFEADLEIVNIQIAIKDFAGALETAKQIDASEQPKIYIQIAAAQAFSRDILGAKAVANEFLKDKLRSEAYFEIAMAQTSYGDMEGAKKTAREIEHASFRFRVYIALGEVGRAILEIPQTPMGIDLSAASLQVVRAQMTSGDIEGAKATAKKIKFWHSSQAYLEIAAAEASSENIEGARNTILMIKNPFYRVKAYLACSDIIYAKEAAAEIVDLKTQSKAYLEIAAAEATSGDIEEARNTALLIKNLFYRVKAHLACGDIIYAKEAAAEMNDLKMQSKAYFKIAAAEAASGKIESAKITAQEIKIRFADDAFQACFEIVKAQASSGDTEGAKQTIEEFVYIYWQYPPSHRRQRLSNAHLEILRIQASSGDIVGAKETAKLLANPVRGFIEIAKVQVSLGDIEGANNTALDAYHPRGCEESDEIRMEISQTQVSLGDLDGAKKTASLIYGLPSLKALCGICRGMIAKNEVKNRKRAEAQ